MFHATNENPNRVRFDALEDWLAKQLQANTPWDEIVAGMITATGRNDENGAVAFPLAHEARPVEMAGEVSRIFMGVQIQCAQCHDHKTDAWKRRQFHEFAAFFAGVQAKAGRQGGTGQLPVFAVVAQGPRRYTMPDMDNPAKQIPIAPRFFLASSKSKPGAGASRRPGRPERRALAASYVTGQDNPWFAKAYINRIWYVADGRGVLRADRRHRARADTQGARGARAAGRAVAEGGIRRPLAVPHDPQHRGLPAAGPLDGQRGRQDPVRLELPQPAPRRPGLRCPRPGPGAAHWMQTATSIQPAEAQRTSAGPAQERPEGPGSSSLGDPKRPTGPAQTKGAAKKAAEAAGLASQVGKKAAAAMRPGGSAAALRPPLRRRSLGRQRRRVGTIPQALFLMNSPLVNSRTQARPGTVLGEILSTAPNDRAALGALYLRVLSRQPTTQEVEICGRYMAGVGNRARRLKISTGA